MKHRTPETSPAVRRAYTLIELLIVVGLLGLAASLLIPHLTVRTSLETQAAVRMIIADISFAQSDAMAHQELRRVHFFEDGSGYCLTRVTGSFDAAFDPETAEYIPDPTSTTGQWIVNFAASDRFSGVQIGEVSLDSNKRYLTFDSLGGTVKSGGGPGTGGSILVTSDQANYLISVAPFTGKLTVEKVD